MRDVAFALAVLAVAHAGCARERNKGPVDVAAASALFEQKVVDTPPGMSDITIDERGGLWGVPERDPVVVAIDLTATPRRFTLEGLAPGVDTEAIVALGGGKFALGYEGTLRPGAGVMFAELRGDKVVVTSTRALTDRDLGVTVTLNHGIEALCGKAGELIAASESIGTTSDGKRWAPLVRLHGDAVHATRLWLTSTKGKISGMHCTVADDGVAQVTAIERHFGVVRILKFTIDRDDTDVTPTIEHDLYPVLHDNYNFEGATRLPDGRLVLINDNQHASIDGPTQVFVFRR